MIDPKPLSDEEVSQIEKAYRKSPSTEFYVYQGGKAPAPIVSVLLATIRDRDAEIAELKKEVAKWENGCPDCGTF